MKNNLDRPQKNRYEVRRQIVRLLMMVYDVLAVNAAYFLALMVRYYVIYDFHPYAVEFVAIWEKMVPIHGAFCVAIFYIFKLYHTLWEFAGLRDLNRILEACVVTGVTHAICTMLFFRRMPISYHCIGFFIQCCMIVASRFGYQLYLKERRYVSEAQKAGANVMIVGAGSMGQFARKRLEQDKDAKVVCMMRPTGVQNKEYLNGIPVYGDLSKLPQILESKKVGYVILADEKLSEETTAYIQKVCDDRHVLVQDYVAYFQSGSDGNAPVVIVKEEEGARKISFSPPDITDKEINEVRHALQSGWITTGPRTKELERKLAAYCHTSKVVCLGSATAAEELNFRICGIGEGDEVIVPAYTYTATASAAIHCGAKVIFVDSQKDNCEMDYDKVAAAITERTKAVVAVDLGGIVADYDKLYAAVESKRHLFHPKEGNDLGARIQQAVGRVLVFADCAHALGARWHNKMAGEIADFTDFSFHAVKNFTTAEGGASTWRDIPGIDNEEIYHQYQLYSLHGQSKDALAKSKAGAWEYDIVGPWYKCNMTDIMAAIGLKQFERYEGLMDRRHAIIRRYDAMCDELGVAHLVHSGADFRSSGHLYLTRIPGITEAQRQEIIEKLSELGVATNVHYKPLPMMTAYKAYGWDIRDFPNAYDYYHNLVTIPLHTKLTDKDVDYVIECYSKVVKEYL